MEEQRNLQKRVKRQILGKLHKARLRFPHGLGLVCLEEAKQYLATPIFPAEVPPQLSLSENAVEIEGISYRELLALTMRLTTARDALLIVGGGRADSVPQLKKKIGQVSWEFFTRPQMTWAIKTTSIASRVFHEGLVKEIVQKELESRGCQIASMQDAPHRLDVRLESNRLEVAVSIAGRYLYQRRYKTNHRSLAPLKEDLASGIVRLAWSDFYPPDWAPRPLQIWLPFAGSGTLAFESAMFFRNIAPELYFGELSAENFPCNPSASVKFARAEIRKRWKESPFLDLSWLLIEKDELQVASLTSNVDSFNAKIKQFDGKPLSVSIIHDDVFALPPPEAKEGSLLFTILNPPYGIRLENRKNALDAYRKVARMLSQLGASINILGAILVPDHEALECFRKDLKKFETKEHIIRHGGKKITAVTFYRRALPFNQ